MNDIISIEVHLVPNNTAVVKPNLASKRDAAKATKVGMLLISERTVFQVQTLFGEFVYFSAS
jgi:hypothetical protein